jgi:class 3 adenylate cyclase
VLIGRGREIRVIEEALAAARLGKSSRLVIRGEPGIGKTALLDHAVSHAAGMRVMSASGVEFEAGVPFAGLHQLLHPALGSIDRLVPIHAAALRSSLGLGERIEADRLIVGAAVLDLVSSYAEDAPLLLTVDDAQWLDRASAEALAFAARRLIADPVAILVAVREGEDSALLVAGLPELRVGGLDARDASDLLEASAAGDLPADIVDRLVGATGGNPLALLELAGSGLHLSSPHDLPVATSVERAYLRRAEGLSAETRQVLVVMAASGMSDPRLAERAAQLLGIGGSEVDAAEGARGLVRTVADRVEFVHPLARAAIYHAASPAQRRAAHRALAGAMTNPDEVDRRAWHLASAAIGADAEAATALEEAAQRARQSSGHDAAAEALAEAARLTEDLELRARRLLRAAENAWLAGRAERGVELLDAARKISRSTQDMVDIDSLDGHIAMRRGAVLEGYRRLTAAAEAIASIDRLKAVRILSDASLAAYGAGQPAEMLVAARKAVDMLQPADPPELVACALVAYGILAILAGRGADGTEKLHESVALFSTIQSLGADPQLLMSAGLAGLFLREAEAGRDLLERALMQARDQAPTAALPSLLFMLGRDAAATDRWSLARALYEESARVARETTQFTWLAGAVGGLAWLAALEGREDECRLHAAEARALGEQYGMGFFKAWAIIALGQLDLAYGHLEGALENFRECAAFLREISIDDPDLSPAPDIVDVLVRRGRLDEARQICDEYGASAAAKGQPFALARAARARGLVATTGFAKEYEEALVHHQATPDVFEQARTQLYYGERLRRTRHRIDARRHLREALKAFDRLGASPWAERAMAELHASGESARLRDDRYGQHLTPQELQVALTLAEGATTREAAARLYLSPKTVEYHLRHVYDKLEVRSREELRAVVMRDARPASSRKALMFTDLARSTSLVEAIGDDAWLNLSAWLDNEMRTLFRNSRGREVDHAGDGFFVVFDSPSDAIECAVNIQRRLASHRRRSGYAPQVRIGIHIGEVSGSESSPRGASVHRAARLCAAAQPDSILVSREALEAAHRPASRMREFVLKGIREPVEAGVIDWHAAH